MPSLLYEADVLTADREKMLPNGIVGIGLDQSLRHRDLVAERAQRVLMHCRSHIAYRRPCHRLMASPCCSPRFSGSAAAKGLRDGKTTRKEEIAPGSCCGRFARHPDLAGLVAKSCRQDLLPGLPATRSSMICLDCRASASAAVVSPASLRTRGRFVQGGGFAIFKLWRQFAGFGELLLQSTRAVEDILDEIAGNPDGVLEPLGLNRRQDCSRSWSPPQASLRRACAAAPRFVVPARRCPAASRRGRRARPRGTRPAARPPVKRVAPPGRLAAAVGNKGLGSRRLVGGASAGRDAIQRSASSSAGERSSKPPGRPAADQ